MVSQVIFLFRSLRIHNDMFVRVKFEYGQRLLFLGLCLGAAFLLPAEAVAQIRSVTLGWQASSDPSVVGYDIYYGSASQDYTNEISAANSTTATIPGLVPGVTYYFAATSYNAQNQQS